MGTKRRRTGFTLVEILVTVAVLAILSAILFNVFARVRENGRIQVCQNNLKQLVLAVQQYAHDNDSQFPGAFWQPQLDPYIKVSSFIWCPTNKALFDALGFKPPFVPRHMYVIGYWYNGSQLQDVKIIKGDIFTAGRHENVVRNPTKTWVHGDDAPANDALSGDGGTLDASPCGKPYMFRNLHNGGANYSFLDGHIKWLTPDAIHSTMCGPNDI